MSKINIFIPLFPLMEFFCAVLVIDCTIFVFLTAMIVLGVLFLMCRRELVKTKFAPLLQRRIRYLRTFLNQTIKLLILPLGLRCINQFRCLDFQRIWWIYLSRKHDLFMRVPISCHRICQEYSQLHHITRCVKKCHSSNISIISQINPTHCITCLLCLLSLTIYLCNVVWFRHQYRLWSAPNSSNCFVDSTSTDSQGGCSATSTCS